MHEQNQTNNIKQELLLSVRFFSVLLSLFVVGLLGFALLVYLNPSFGSNTAFSANVNKVGLFWGGLLITSGLLALWDWLTSRACQQHEEAHLITGEVSENHKKIKELEYEILVLETKMNQQDRLNKLNSQKDNLHNRKP